MSLFLLTPQKTNYLKSIFVAISYKQQQKLILKIVVRIKKTFLVSILSLFKKYASIR